MKAVALREAKQGLSAYIDQSQKERVLILRHGRPAALLIGVEGKDLEEIVTVANPAFWKLIEERRQQPSLSLEEAERQFAEHDVRKKPPPRAPAKRAVPARPVKRSR